MASCSGNIDVVIDIGDRMRPSCPHGPALLFTKYIQGSEDKTGGCQRRFFACSAFRDRKACPFFQWEDEKISTGKMRIREEINRQNAPPFTHKQYWKRFLQLKDLSKNDRSFCHTCGLLLLPEERASHKSSGHKITSPITGQMLHRPSQLFVPLDANKTYAQYLFAEPTVDFLLKTLQALKFTHILCVGCPRIHESIQIKCNTDMETSGGLNSLLLDLDYRFFQIYPPSLFCQYNMFNHHFFDGKSSEEVCRKFLTEEDGMHVAVVMDPPFGGMVEALAATFKKIEHTWQMTSNKPSNCHLPVFLFFPYFMEKRILDCVPEFCMLDYKVDYDNHLLFTGTKGKKKGSPVRIFCNIPPNMVKLPEEDGYCISSEPRTVLQCRKQYDNIEQRAKERLHEIKMPQTGGGPKPSDPPLRQQLLLEQLGGRPQMCGLYACLDTEVENLEEEVEKIKYSGMQGTYEPLPGPSNQSLSTGIVGNVTDTVQRRTGTVIFVKPVLQRMVQPMSTVIDVVVV